MAKYNITEKSSKHAAYRVHLNAVIMKDLKEKIHNIIVDKRKFADKNYSAQQLAKDLRVNMRYVSAVINVGFGMNYSSYVNKLRVEEAVAILSKESSKGMSMEQIGSNAGFSNRQTFYASFYKYMQTTPRKYYKKIWIEQKTQKKHI